MLVRLEAALRAQSLGMIRFFVKMVCSNDLFGFQGVAPTYLEPPRRKHVHTYVYIYIYVYIICVYIYMHTYTFAAIS